MIDEGIDQLTELVTVCNPYHGSYDAANGYVSRHGMPIAFLPSMPAAIGHAAAMPYGYAWVDFNMPELTPTQQMLDLGQEMWNKALLFGARKYYSPASTALFEGDGWPYKTPSGAVWRMRGSFSGGMCYVYGELLTPESLTTGMPITELASISITRPTLPLGFAYATDSFVNFNPKGGAEAAIHAFAYNNDPSEVAAVVVEVSLSGGDAVTPPTISMTQTYGQVSSAVIFTEQVNVDNDNIVSAVFYMPVNTIVSSVSGGVTVTSDTSLPDQSGYFQSDNESNKQSVDAKYPWLLPAGYIPPSDYPTNNYSTKANGYRATHHRLCFVGYNKAGARVVVEYEQTFSTDWAVTQVGETLGSSLRRCVSHDYGATWSVLDTIAPWQLLTDHTVTWQNIVTSRAKSGFKRNGVLVPSAKEYEVRQTYTVVAALYTSSSAVVSSTVAIKQINCSPLTLVNGAYNNYIRNDDAAPPSDGQPTYYNNYIHVNANAVCNFSDHPYTSQRSVTEYCDADYDFSWRGWTDWVVNTSTLPLPHPETGAVEKKRLFYF